MHCVKIVIVIVIYCWQEVRLLPAACCRRRCKCDGDGGKKKQKKRRSKSAKHLTFDIWHMRVAWHTSKLHRTICLVGINRISPRRIRRADRAKSWPRKRLGGRRGVWVMNKQMNCSQKTERQLLNHRHGQSEKVRWRRVRERESDVERKRRCKGTVVRVLL